MRVATSTYGAIFLAALVAQVATAAPPQNAPGELHRIDIEKAPHPRAYHPHVGDMVQCMVSFAVTPDTMLDDVKVSVEGKSIQYVAFVNTTEPEIVGAVEWSVYLLPVRPGLSHVEFAIQKPEQKPETFSMAFLVEPLETAP